MKQELLALGLGLATAASAQTTTLDTLITTNTALTAHNTPPIMQVTQGMPAPADSQLVANEEDSGLQDYISFFRPMDGPQTGYFETNIFLEKGLPFSMNGYTFMDFFRGNAGYYGETTLEKPLGESGLSLKTQTVHANEFFTRQSFGLGYVVPLPEAARTFLKVGVMPLTLNNDGSKTTQPLVDWYISHELGAGLTLSTFGDIEDNGQWGYGEAELRGQWGGPVSVSINAALLNDGPRRPDIDVRVQLSYDIDFEFSQPDN
ncbi:MAG: hypothetical protein H6502_00155 [Candidatus Woesearchaeota archaeon]|nr:MAG: hypothetical protein H6502_00155 [Candidatus Woesearchaeota archaeon]